MKYSAKNYALMLLEMRPRTRLELKERLRKKGYEEQETERVLNELEEASLIDDRKFAASWVRNKIEFKPIGKRLMAMELKRKGIDKEIIDDIINKEFALQDEETLAYNIASKKKSSYKKLDELKEKKRLFSFLIRRGFNMETVSRVLNRIYYNENE